MDSFRSIAEAIFSPELITQTNQSSISRRDSFIGELFVRFYEVFTAYQTLVDFPALSDSKPPRYARSLTTSVLLTFWREAYLNEFYVLLCRIERLVCFLERAYKSDADLPHLRRFKKEFLNAIEKAFGWIKKMRGSHVHAQRYSHSDPELRRLQLLEVLAVDGPMKTILPLYKKAVRECRKNNKRHFRDFTTKARYTLKVLFDSLEEFILDGENSLVFPPESRPNKEAKQSKPKKESNKRSASADSYLRSDFLS